MPARVADDERPRRTMSDGAARVVLALVLPGHGVAAPKTASSDMSVNEQPE
jgi:hypothetical protein